MASNPDNKPLTCAKTTADQAAASWYYSAVVLLVLMMMMLSSFGGGGDFEAVSSWNHQQQRGPCEEIYVVGEGETVHTISDKCGDPFILEENPHIHDPDDVFPGLVIKITPTRF